MLCISFKHPSKTLGGTHHLLGHVLNYNETVTGTPENSAVFPVSVHEAIDLSESSKMYSLKQAFYSTRADTFLLRYIVPVKAHNRRQEKNLDSFNLSIAIQMLENCWSAFTSVVAWRII